MKWRVYPSTLSGVIAIPPSKSHTIRALLVAMLARGTSIIHKPLQSGDGASAIGAAQCFGAEVEHIADGLRIRGIGSDLSGGSDIIEMGNSGTGTNLFAAAAALGSRARRFDGDSSLRSRPFKALLDALSGLGASYTLENQGRDLPFTIRGPLKGGVTTVDGISSQFLSGLLLTCPLIADGDTTISVYNLHERPYVELTLWWLSRQNIKVEYSTDFSVFKIPGNQAFTPFDMTVPADFSSATFAAVAAAIAGSGVGLAGLDFSDPQGDKGVFEVLSSMGVVVTHASDCVEITRSDSIAGREIDLNNMPDALPALSVLACMAEGETRFINVQQARIKETDRIAVMVEELTKMGADIRERPDGLVVRQSTLKGALVNGHDDHRVVMALALAGFVAEGETVIESAEAAEVTYPTFVKDFRNIGARIEIEKELDL